MKRLLIVLIFCLSLSISYCLDLPHTKLTYPELKLEIPTVTQFTMKNGLKVYYINDSTLPIIKMALFVKGGSFTDSKSTIGLSGLLASAQRDGGNHLKSASDLDQFLEERGATIAASSSDTVNEVSMQCLSTDLKDIMPLYVSTALHPSFDKKRFEIQRKLALESLRRQNDEAAQVVRRRFNKLIYKDHVAGNQASFETVSSIDLNIVKKEHKKRFRPDGAQLLVVGDIELASLKKLLAKSFDAWKAVGTENNIDTSMNLDFAGERQYIEMDTPQLNIRVGHKSLKLSNPDYYPLLIADYILGGGGFNSRLMQKVRTEMGLAYSIYSYIWGDVYYGTMGVYCGTKTQGAVDSLSEILNQINKIRDQKVSQKEFDLAKNTMINQYVFKFSSKYQVASRMLYFERKNLPADFMQKYLESLKKVTIEDVQAAAKKYWKPESLKILLVGKVSSIKDKLQTKFGSFKEQKLEKAQ